MPHVPGPWLLVAMTLLPSSLATAQDVAAGASWPRSPAYASAAAHDPRYADRSLWPAWVEQTAFVKESWPQARVLVWRHAGKTMRGVDASDAAHWLEDGKPAARGPDAGTDVVFPTAPDGQRTHLAGDKGCQVRHMTVEAGVGAFLKSVNVHGNLWIKAGGSFHQVQPHGDRDTFMRNDALAPNLAANKIAFNKPPQKSIEWMGNWKLGDELDLFSGRFIVAPDSTFLPGDRSTQHIYPKATLVLLSGSTFQKRGNQYWGNEIEVVGTVLAGTPDRPLTRDATIGISFKAKGRGGAHLSQPGDTGLIVYRQGTLAVHSADPRTARLVFRRNDLPAQSFAFKGGEPPDVVAMPHGIDMLLLGQLQLDGVEFNDLLVGGIRMPDPSARNAWKNVTFGKGNFGLAAQLFATYAGDLDLRMKDTGVAAGLARDAAKAQAASQPAAPNAPSDR